MPIAPQTITATIASGETTSGAIPLKGTKITSVFVPTLTSGTLTVECSYDGSNNWAVMKDTNGATVGQWSAGTFNHYLDGDSLARFLGVNFIRFVSGASQGADRTLYITVAQE